MILGNINKRMKLFQAAWRMLFATIAFTLSGCVLAESAPENRAIHERRGTTDVQTQEATNPTEAARYIGMKLDPSSEVTHERYWNSFLIRPKVNYADPSARSRPQAEALGGVIYIGDQEQRVLLLVESETDESGKACDLVLDAINIPRGLDLAGWEGEYDCIYETRHQENVIAIGKWKAEVAEYGLNRKVYMSPIIMAWKVDFQTKKFIEIPKHKVSCINRNSTDAQ